MRQPLWCLISASLKYGPVRDQLESFIEKYPPRGDTLSALELHKVLRLTAQSMNQLSMPVWTQNCGRGVAYHSGPVLFLTRIGILRKVNLRSGGSSAQASALILLGQEKLAYELCKLSDPLKDTLQKMLQLSPLIRQFQSRPSGPWRLPVSG